MTDNKNNKGSGFKYRGSLVGPIILITIGIVFLLTNTGYLSGDAWETILNLWPVILIAIGLDSVLHRRGVAVPTLFIGMGVILLLSNFELLEWNVWDLLVQLWPILLIAIGLDIVIGHQSIWGAGLALVLILAILAGALWYFNVGPGGAITEKTTVIQPLDGISTAEIVLQPSVGSVNIISFTSSKNLVEGTIRKWKGEIIQEEYTVNNKSGEYSLSSTGVSISLPFSLPSEASWNLNINQDIPTNLDIKLGAGETDLDLHDLPINGLTINVAVGTMNVILPRDGRVSGNIENAVGSIIIIVPQDTALRIVTETGLSNIQVPPGYRKTGNIYSSPGYGSAENRVDLVINQAIGLVRIKSE